MNVNTLPPAPSSLNFDNAFARELPSDPDTSNRRRQVSGSCYSRVLPASVAKPTLVLHSAEVATMLGLEADAFVSPTRGQASPETLLQAFSGNRLLDGMDPYACCYGGHQFGSWAGQLGDGRAINLGEIVNPAGERFALQLKGAGPTPYSRTADGLAVLRSSIREFLCSEAMFHLGVPTTRALSLVTTGESVLRDMFYDGNARHEPGAIVCRIAPTFTRFGSFEIHTSRDDITVLRQLADFTIRQDFPHLGEPNVDTYIAWFDEVCQSTAVMVAHWMRVGFVHGVMNTDNMSICGLTIDYGPYGWLEDFDLDWTPNTTDAGGKRYRYGQQPQVALWNLVQLANAIYPLIEDADRLRGALQRYSETYAATHGQMMAEKLGLKSYQADTDDQLFEELHTVLTAAETDMTLFFRLLPNVDLKTASDTTDAQVCAALRDAYYQPEELDGEACAAVAAWLRSYAERALSDGRTAAERRRVMERVNPLYVMRNYLAQLAIDKAQTGDFSLVQETLDVMRHPYTEQPGRKIFAEKRPEWARHRAGCSMLSCSS